MKIQILTSSNSWINLEKNLFTINYLKISQKKFH